MTKYYLAIDIGASSGRHIVGYLSEDKIVTEEIYRFPNGVLEVDGHLVWDIEKILFHVKEGIKKTLSIYSNLESMSIDTWGVDYVLMNGNKEILPCYAYRDKRTEKLISEVHSIIPYGELYRTNGVAFQSFNTIYQFYADKVMGRLDKADSFLMIPEYLMFKLTGKKVHEYTNASTTALLDGKTKTYSEIIIKRLGFNEKLFGEIKKPGFVLGGFTEEVKNEVGGNITCILCPTHDTASAAEGIIIDDNAPYISSGTWSLLGIKTKDLICNSLAMNANYSNELGPYYVRFQKNIMGLWIVQGLSKQMEMDFSKMVELATTSHYEHIFDVNDQVFLSSLDMRTEIIDWFKNNNITPPTADNDIINSVFVSLAYSYKVALEELESIIGISYDKLYIVGGGAKNKYLNELTEKYTAHKVIALPIEATAIGNLKFQMEN